MREPSDVNNNGFIVLLIVELIVKTSYPPDENLIVPAVFEYIPVDVELLKRTDGSAFRPSANTQLVTLAAEIAAVDTVLIFSSDIVAYYILI